MTGRTLTAALACVLALSASAAARTCTWKASSGHWTDAKNWGPTGPPRGKADTGLIRSGSVILNASPGGPGNRPTLLVSRGGTAIHRKGLTLECPVILDGGTYASVAHWAGDMPLTGPIVLRSDSLFTGVRGSVLRLTGPVSGKGKLVVKSRDAYKGSGLCVVLAHANTYSGGTWLTGDLPCYVKVAADRGLGSGPVRVDAGRLQFSAAQDDARPPKIVVGAKGALALDTGSLSLGATFNGGRLGVWLPRRGNVAITGPLRLNGVTGVYAAMLSRINVAGRVSGKGGLSVRGSGKYWLGGTCGWVVLSGKANTYSGGTQVLGGLQVTGDRALGAGPVVVRGAGIRKNANLGGGLSMDVQQSYAAGTQPSVTVEPGGAIYVNVASGTHLNMDVVLNGGEISGAWREEKQNGLAGTVTLAADSYVGGAKGSLELRGRVTGPHKLIKHQNLSPHRFAKELPGPIVLSGRANDYSGGTEIRHGVLRAGTDGALGLGDVVVFPGGTLELAAPLAMDWRARLYLAGARSRLKLASDTTVYAVNLGGRFQGGSVTGGRWLVAGTYHGGFGPYVDFSGHTLTVLSSGRSQPIPETTTLTGLLLGAALLRLRNIRRR